MTRRLHVVALVAVLGLVLAACGEAKDTGFSNLPAASPGGDGHGDGGGAATEIQLLAGNTFKPAEFKTKVGTPVTWKNADASGQPHNVVEDNNLFDSNPDCLKDQTKCMPVNSTFQFTFDKAGTYQYYCVIHGTTGGVGMAGKIIVE